MFDSSNISLNAVPSTLWVYMHDMMSAENTKDGTSGNVMSTSDQNFTPGDIERELETLYPVVYRSVSAMIWGSGLDAEDLTQDVFLKAYRNASKFKMDSSLSTWVYRISRNTVIDALRKKKLRSMFMGFWNDPSDGGMEPVSPDSETDAFESRETQNLVRLAIASLPEQYRSIVVWREIEELPYSQISEITGESEGTLKSRLFYAKKRLREILIARGLHYEIE